jgi:signal transduction histidine kinase
LLHQYKAHDSGERRHRTELRDAAIAARAKLAAEVMEILFSDARNALEGTLNAVPLEGTLPFLQRWREVNPLVSTALLVNARGTFEPGKHWPAEMAREYEAAPRAPEKWLAKTPWHPGAVAEKTLAPAAPDAVSEWKPLREKLRAAAARDPYSMREISGAAPFPAPVSAGSVGNLPPSGDYAKAEAWSERRRRLGIPFSERTGWEGVPNGLFAWRMCDDDIVLVAGINLRELAALLAGVLPARTESDESYRLLAGSAAASGTEARGDFIRDFPVHPELLPGWAVRAVRKESGAGAFHAEILYDAAAAVVILLALIALLFLYFFQKRARENEKTALAASYASHEIKNRLQAIQCCADSICPPDGGAGGEKQAEYVHIIQDAVDRLGETTAFILNFSPKAVHGEKIRVGNVNLSRVAAKQLEACKLWLKQNAGMDLVSKVPEEPVCAATNDAVFSIILQNLLYNAGQHAAEGGRVEVSLTEVPAAETIELRVRDYGPGVRGTRVKHIFDFRRQLDKQERGHGIGLPFSRMLARAVGGDLFCETPSDGAGGGVFVFSLPKK